MNKRVDGLKTFYVDVDDTLIMHDISEYVEHHHDDSGAFEVRRDPDEMLIEDPLSTGDSVYKYIPNDKNINTIKKFYKLGYTIIVWSKTGSDWAEKVCKKLEIDSYVTCYLSKPMFYLDDKDVHEWIGPRIWRDADGKRYKEKLYRKGKENE